MDPNHKKLKTLLTNTVLQFCRDDITKMTSQGGSLQHLAKCLFNGRDEARSDTIERETASPSPAEQGSQKDSSPSPLEEHRNRRWLKRKALLQSSSTTLKKPKGSAESAGNENELGIVKIEQDVYSPPEDSTLDSVDSTAATPINSFLGFGDDAALRHSGAHGFTPNNKKSILLTGGELVMGEVPVEYSYNQAEYIAAMNRDGAGVEDPNTMFNKTKEPTNYLQHVEKKEPDKYRCTICGKEYSNRGSIYRHIDKHLGRSFSCDYCGSTFESHSGWTRHIRTIHAQHMNFSCDKCPQKFYQKNALEQHYTRIHSKDEPKGETSNT